MKKLILSLAFFSMTSFGSIEWEQQYIFGISKTLFEGIDATSPLVMACKELSEAFAKELNDYGTIEERTKWKNWYAEMLQDANLKQLIFRDVIVKSLYDAIEATPDNTIVLCPTWGEIILLLARSRGHDRMAEALKKTGRALAMECNRLLSEPEKAYLKLHFNTEQCSLEFTLKTLLWPDLCTVFWFISFISTKPQIEGFLEILTVSDENHYCYPA